MALETQLMSLDRDIDSFKEKILVHHLVHESFSLKLDMLRDDGSNWVSNAVFRIILSTR